MHKADATSEHELFVFAAGDDNPVDTADSRSPWIILIVDDEPDVHGTTLLALRGLVIRAGRGKLDRLVSVSLAQPKAA